MRRLNPTEACQAVAGALAPLQEVAAALIFGSQAAGRTRTDSDIDVAVLLAADAVSRRRKDLLRTLLAALGQALPADRIDLVILNDAPPKLAFHVLKHGQVAFERSREPLHRFRVSTYSRHADYEPIERFFMQAIKARAGAPGG